MFPSPNPSDYDPATGCLRAYNAFSEYHDELLRQSLQPLRLRYPHAKIMFGDYNGASMRFYRAPGPFGKPLYLVRESLSGFPSVRGLLVLGV